MQRTQAVFAIQQEWADEEIIDRVLQGDVGAYELLIRRYNQRVYRVVRSILRDDSEAEDVMQEAFVRAYKNLAQFEGRSAFSTWLGRIAVHEALARLERSRRFEPFDFATVDSTSEALRDTNMSPEQQTAISEAREMLEKAILALPPKYRTVLMLRDVDEMSTSETAATLDMSEEAVKVRLHRARALLRKELYAIAGATSTSAFQFPAPRCNRVTRNAMNTIFALSL